MSFALAIGKSWPRVLRAAIQIGLLICVQNLLAERAIARSKNFTATFANCSEFVGLGPVDLSLAKPLVPSNFVISAAPPGTALMFARITHCGTAQIGWSLPVPTTISQVGISVDAPDGTGTINNYLILYVTDNLELSEALNEAGAPAEYDPNMAYEFTLNSAGTGGEFYGAVAGEELPGFFFYGTGTLPVSDAPPSTFIANWWFGSQHPIKEATTVPDPNGANAAFTLFTSKNSPLGKLIGGNAYGPFSFVSLRNTAASETMVVNGQGRH